MKQAQREKTKRGPYKNVCGHNAFIAVRLKSAHVAALKAKVEAQASTVSQFVRKLIERELANFEAKANN